MKIFYIREEPAEKHNVTVEGGEPEDEHTKETQTEEQSKLNRL